MTTKSRKTNLNELNIFGGEPLFPDFLHVGRPNIGNPTRLFERIEDMLDRRWFTNNGPFVQEFEQKIAGYIGVKHCVAMCNATIGLEIAIRALGLSGEVIVPSFTFIATAHALQWQEITPVFCEIDPVTHNIDPSKVEQLITPKTTGILGVHVWGRACDVETLSTIAQRYNLKLLFDAAHAFGCSFQRKMIGNFGDAEVLSFHATKFFNTFEGGAVVTNNDELAEKIRLMRNFGFAGMDNVIYIGTNGKMSEISAAMGLTSLDNLNKFIEVNRTNYDTYRSGLGKIPGIQMIEYDLTEKNNFQYIVVEVDESIIGIDRDQMVKILHAENVRARRYFYPGCHQMEPYRSYFPNAGILLPETEKLTKCVLQFPTGTSVGEMEILQICQLIEMIAANGQEIKSMLSKQ